MSGVIRYSEAFKLRLAEEAARYPKYGKNAGWFL
jgi:hypothetical protein